VFGSPGMPVISLPPALSEPLDVIQEHGKVLQEFSSLKVYFLWVSFDELSIFCVTLFLM
jgi:hypothetical protein